MHNRQRRLLAPFEAFIAFCLAAMLVLVFGNVLLRYALNSGLTVSDELSRLLFIWMVFMGALVALCERRHLGVDTLVARLSRRGRMICFVLANLLMLYATWLMFQGGWKQGAITLGATTPVMGISQAWFYAPALIFAALSGLWFLRQLLRAVTGRIGDSELIGVQETEEDIAAAMHRPAADAAAGPDTSGDQK